MYSLLDWLEAVRFRWKLVAVAMALLTGIALIYLSVSPKTYTAQASLLVDRQQPNPVEEKKGDSAANAKSVMATQADLIRSPRVAGDAAVMAGLDKDPEYIAQWRETGGRTPYREWLKQRMISALTVSPGKDTNILVIAATAADPTEAARLANGFAKAAVASRFRLRTEPAKAYATWLENQMLGARARLVERQKAVSDFVRKTGLAQGEDLSAEGSQVAGMAGQLATAEARAAGARQSAHTAAQGRGDAERSSTIQRLRGQVAEGSAKLAQLQAIYGPEYPEVQRTKAELSTLQSSLNSELAYATSAFNAARSAESAAERQAAVASEQRLRSLTSQQRSRLQSMGVNVAQYATLKNDFTAAQNNYNELNQRLSQMKLQAAIPQTEVQVLDPASRFLVSRSPDSRMTITLALLLGLVLGALAAILLEYLNPRVRSLGGVERLLGIPVIGRVALPKPAPRALGGPRGPLLLQSGAN